jgi:hypothetical protein
MTPDPHPGPGTAPAGRTMPAGAGLAGAAPPAAGNDRAAYLAQMCRLLWPEPASITLRRVPSAIAERPAGAASSEFIVLPGAGRPRLIVPATDRASAAAAVRRYGEPGSARAQLATRALSVLLRSGAGSAVLRDRLRIGVPAGTPTIETYLRDQLGGEISVSMHLGAARANRKPVLQLLAPGGATVGFAKIGVSALTSDLVRAERDALDRLSAAGLISLRVPEVLHFGCWRDLPVLVLSPLPVWQRRVPLTASELRQAMAEVAAVDDGERGPLTASAYWKSLARRLDSADQGADRSALLAAIDAVTRRGGDTEVSFGAWHGDWTPWNMASTREGLLVWDWERFTAGVPAGFDALHYWLQSQVVSGGRDPGAAAADCVARAPGLLGPFGVTPAPARLTALAYLADLATRYLADRQEAAGARLGSPGWWLVPAIAAGAAQLAAPGAGRKGSRSW